MKTRINILSAILPVLLCLSLIFSSCAKEENPVKTVDPPPPPTGPDTVSQYVYSVYYNVGGYVKNVYAADTDKVFIIGNAQLLLYNGNNISVYPINDPNLFKPFDVSGYDKDNIFIYGQYNINSNKHLPIFKKITNGIISTYPIGDTGDIINDFIVTGPNQVWFSEIYNSSIYYFNNGSIRKYKLNNNDSIFAGYFYLNPNNELFLFAYDALRPDPGSSFYTYKFINDNFVLQKKDCYDIFPCNTYKIFKCGKDIIMGDESGFCKTKYFDGSDWIFHSAQDTIDTPYKMGGVSKDSLIGMCGNDKLYTYGVNKKWRRENGSPRLIGALFYLPMSNIEMKYGNIYFTYRDAVVGSYTSFIVGRPNKNYKK